MIRLMNISHRYDYSEVDVLQDISFTINPGECIGLTGPSGCGKSTLAKIIAGHLFPSKGEVFTEGKDITGKPGRHVFLFHQESDLFPWQTVNKQVRFAFKTKDPTLLKYFLHLVKLDGHENYYPRQLSGGMKKRLAMARALAVNPKLLILDESFNSLDLEMKKSLYQDLKYIWKATGTTILLITHDSRDLQHLAQREIELTPGPSASIAGIRQLNQFGRDQEI